MVSVRTSGVESVQLSGSPGEKCPKLAPRMHWIALVKTTLHLDKELSADLPVVKKLVGECKASVLRLALREGFAVLKEKFKPKEDKKPKPEKSEASA